MSRNGRGFEDEARLRVIDAARRSGLSVGDLVQALSETPRRAPARDADPSPDRDLERRLDALSERMRRLGADTAPQSRPEPPPRRDRDTPPDATFDELAAAVGRLSGGPRTPAPERAARPEPRIEPRPEPRIEPRTDETVRILDMLEGLDRRVRALGEETGTRRPAAAPVVPPAPIVPPAPVAPAVAVVPTPAPVPTPSPAAAPVETPAVRARRASMLDEPRPARRAVASDTEALDRRFRELGEKIDALRQTDDRDGSADLIAEIRALRGFVESRAGGDTDVSGEIRRLAGRIDRLAEQRPQREVIESVATELGRLRDVVLQTNVEGSLRSIEAGYGHIVDRLDDLKRDLADPRGGDRIDAEIAEIRSLLTAVPKVDHLSSLERNFGALAEKFERLAARQETPASQQIERRLADLRKQIDAFDPSRIVVSLDQRLQAVADRLDALERSTRTPVASDRVVKLLEELRTIAAGNRTTEQMTALEARIEELGRRIADYEARRPSFEDTDRLHERIAEIAGRLDEIAADETERASGARLEAAAARLDAAIAKTASPRTEELIDARFDDLIDRLDRRMPADPTAEVEALTREITEMRRELAARRPSDDLEVQMRLLAERLDRSVAHEGDDETLGQIEEQLAHISRQLAVSQDRFADFASLEDHILGLAERMEASQGDTVAAAREAARDMVRELAATLRDDGVGEATLRALQDDLRALQSAARETETRNADTLVSLHDALTGIVGRLAAIEKIAQGSARSAAAARTAAQAAETMAQAVSQQAVAAPLPPAETPRSPGSPAISRSRRCSARPMPR
jgi:localization factor PodJL